MSELWDAGALAQSPIHQHLAERFAVARWMDWPSDHQLTRLLPANACTLSGKPLRFVAQVDAGQYGAAAYEVHIDESGEIPIRPCNWHDFFNALMWICFPATKTALNNVHIQELAQGSRARSARRDAVTLLDECGVLLPVADPRLTRRHADHHWHDLFVQERAAWGRSIEPLVLGHGLYEQCLRPYIGLTAKALHLPVPPTWFAQAPDERRKQIDTRLAAAIVGNEAVLSTRELLPLPVLGVPHWWEANEDPGFYANKDYFRDKS